MKKAGVRRSAKSFQLHTLTLFGETKLMIDWAKDPRCDVSYTTLLARIKNAWPEEPQILAYDPRNYAGKRQFRAFIPDGTCLGDFATIAKATQAINELSETGSIEWLFYGTVIPIPRPPKKGPGRGKGKVLLTAWNETKAVSAWAKDPRCVVSLTTLYNRVRTKKKQWSPESAMTTPAKELYVSARTLDSVKKYEAFGEIKTLLEWAVDPRCKAQVGLLRKRIRDGMPVEEALTKQADERFRGRAHEPAKLEAFGESKTLAEWGRDPRCEVSGYKVLRDRVRAGIPLEQALTTPPDHWLLRPTAFGETKTTAEWSKDLRCSVSYKLLKHRINSGMPLEKALSFEREKYVEAFGERKSLIEWARDPRCQVPKNILGARLRKGIPPEGALALKQEDAHRILNAFGERKTLAQWLKDPRLKSSPTTFLERVAAGETLEEALTRAD